MAGTQIMLVGCHAGARQIESVIQRIFVDPVDKDPRHIETHNSPPRAGPTGRKIKWLAAYMAEVIANLYCFCRDDPLHLRYATV
jgi:hypothetical protein